MSITSGAQAAPDRGYRTKPAVLKGKFADLRVTAFGARADGSRPLARDSTTGRGVTIRAHRHPCTKAWTLKRVSQIRN
jgi:hypothetical protein